MENKNFVLIKLDYRYENIQSKAGTFSKLSPAQAPPRLDEETFDYFETVEDANEEAIKRRKEGLPVMENLVVGGKDMMKKTYKKEDLVNDSKRKPGTRKGITNSDTMKPGRQEQRDNAKEIDRDGQVSDPNLDLNADGVNDEKDRKIADAVVALSKEKYKELVSKAKALKIPFVGKKKEVLAQTIAEAENASEAE